MPKVKFPKSLDDVRKAIQKVNPLFNITRNRAGGGYYYFYSDDKKVGVDIYKNYSTSVYVYNCRELSLDRWESIAREIQAGTYRN